MGHLKKFFNDLLQASLVDAAKTLLFLGIGAAFAALTSASSASYLSLSGYQFWLLVGIMTAFLMYLGIVLYERSTGTKPIFAPLDSNFRFRGIEIELKYLTPDTMQYTKTKRLTALKNNIGSFYDQFHWTGDADLELRCADPNHRLGDRPPKNVWRRYEIDFQRLLKENDQEDITVIWDLSDKKGNFVPFISTPIDHPTEQVELQLDASAIAGRIGKVFVEVLPLMGGGDPVETHELSGRDGVFRFEAENPRLLHTYEMRWNMLG